MYFGYSTNMVKPTYNILRIECKKSLNFWYILKIISGELSIRYSYLLCGYNDNDPVFEFDWHNNAAAHGLSLELYGIYK